MKGDYEESEGEMSWSSNVIIEWSMRFSCVQFSVRSTDRYLDVA